MRLILLGASALLLAGCNGEEYPVPASEAFATLSSVGKPAGLYPLPIGVHEVSVAFESIPSESSVKWKFRHAGDDLATIIARVDPNGDAASNVSYSFVEGTAPADKWRNGPVRNLLRNYVQQLVVEAVDSRFEHRPFNPELRASVTASTASASVSAMMKDVSASMDAHIAKQAQYERESEAQSAMNPRNATKPMTDLSKFR